MGTENKPQLAFVLDWETGGLSCVECGVTQISIHAIRLDTLEQISKFMRYILPYKMRNDVGKAKSKKVMKKKYEDGETTQLMKYEQSALEVQGVTMDTLYQLGIPLEDMVQQLIEWMDEVMKDADTVKGRLPILIGQNITFDEGFLSQVIEYTGTQSEFKKRMRGDTDFWGNWHPKLLDTVILAQLALAHNPEVSSYKLELLCEQLGIDIIDAHDADADVEATEDVVRVLANRMRVAADGDYNVTTIDKQELKTRKHFKI